MKQIIFSVPSLFSSIAAAAFADNAINSDGWARILFCAAALFFAAQCISYAIEALRD
jgi:4-hydroxybenzoate polyprenyltransferase